MFNENYKRCHCTPPLNHVAYKNLSFVRVKLQIFWWRNPTSNGLTPNNTRFLSTVINIEHAVILLMIFLQYIRQPQKCKCKIISNRNFTWNVIRFMIRVCIQRIKTVPFMGICDSKNIWTLFQIILFITQIIIIP